MTTHHTTEHDTVVEHRVVDTAQQIEYPYFLRGVDPRDLRTTGNSRVVGDIRERRPALVASIAEHGLNPAVSVINVVPDPDGILRVTVGFHRTAAAVAVTESENPELTVDVLVHAPGTTRSDQLIAQGIENFLREGYTPPEEASLYAQIALEGLDDDNIARQLSRPLERIRAGRAVAASALTTATGHDMPELDLITLAQLSEFADNAADHDRLVETLRTRPRDFEHTVGQLRRRRAQQEKQSAEQDRLIALGYAMIDDGYDPPEGGEALEDLCVGNDPAPMQPAEHAACPGRAASIDVDGADIIITEFCLDYARHGHRTIAAVRADSTRAQLREQGIRVLDADEDTESDEAAGSDDTPDAGGPTESDADPSAATSPGAVVEDSRVELWRLFADTDAVRPLSVEEHAACPGHAAYVGDGAYGFRGGVHYICTDFAEHGHVLRGAAAVPADRDPAWQTGERRRAGVNNAAWREAQVDRRDWLHRHFTGWRTARTTSTAKPATRAAAAKAKSAKLAAAPMLPARGHHWLALAPVLASDYLTEAAPAHRYACTLLGLEEPQGYQRDRNPIAVLLRKKATTEAQAVIIRLAQVIGACEEHWDRAHTNNADSSWRSPTDSSRFYFELLDALGYPLSLVEQLINNPAADAEKWPHLAGPATATDGDRTH